MKTTNQLLEEKLVKAVIRNQCAENVNMLFDYWRDKRSRLLIVLPVNK